MSTCVEVKMNKQASRFIKNYVWNDNVYKYVDLPSLCGDKLSMLPYVMRLLLENAARNHTGEEQLRIIASVFEWLQFSTSQKEIPFQPGRILMHDTTSTPALVDMAAMRDSLAELGIDPSLLNPSLQVDVSVDHSLAVEHYAKQGAAEENLALEMQRNEERYSFLRWASKAFKNVHINPPGTGIMHTINLEQLATVITTEIRDNELWMVPDMMLGTDSHTPMVNGIGVLGWGVGGLEAQSVMFGVPTMLRIPDIVGVKLVGELSAIAQATDLALTVTHRLRKLDVTGAFVEFFGPGVSSLTADDRCVIANMAPEYGATSGFFASDEQTLSYLKRTGRDPQHIALVEEFSRKNGLWFDPDSEPLYSRKIEIDLSVIGIHAAGPKRPQDLVDYNDIPDILAPFRTKPKIKGSLPEFPVAVAAITSCTNTTNPQLLISAGLFARNANKFGLKVPDWVKTSLAPGSPAAASYLQRSGLLNELATLGFDIVGYGCTSCIGNSGPLPEIITEAQNREQIKAVAALSGNRNFPGRIHPDLDLSFIMSPALVIAFAISGDAQKDLALEPLNVTEKGQPIFLKDLWPSREEIVEYTNKALKADDFSIDFKKASHNRYWDKLVVADSPLFPWDNNSNTLRRPTFVDSKSGSLLGHYSAYPLMVFGDDVTTDHISPASAIPSDSFIADFLVERGENREDLNVFASRRGNWEVMMRGTFYNKTLENKLSPDAPVGHTLHVPSERIYPIWVVADKYREANQPTVIIAGERYGMGSSRDWAAKGQQLLNVHAVLAISYERIHRSNLIGMGILPLIISKKDLVEFTILPGEKIDVIALPENIKPQAKVQVYIRRQSDTIVSIETTAAVETQLESEILRHGGVFQSILKRYSC